MELSFSQESHLQSESQDTASRRQGAANHVGQHALPTSGLLDMRRDSNARRRDITQVLGDALSRVLLQGSDAEIVATERLIEREN